MSTPRILLLVAVSCSAGGCSTGQAPPLVGAPHQGAPPSEPVAPPPDSATTAPAMSGAPAEAAPSPTAGGDSPSGEPTQAEALADCQAAGEELDGGDAAAALRLVDRCYAAMLALDDRDDAAAQTKRDIRMMVAELVRRAYLGPAHAAQDARSWELGLPLIDNEHVQREIRSFLGPEREQFLAAYARSGRYRPFILAKLEEAGLPPQLSWLPLVESLFKVSALSQASALGLWQFISSTGLRYGLKRDAWVDERLDPEKSTLAALAYLSDLHDLFGDWPKALAAYNCGESRVQRLQSRSSAFMDFWDLYATLPDETRRYVPRLIAALQIIEDPARFGVVLPDVAQPTTELVVVSVERAIKLEALEAALQLTPGTISDLNPELRFKATPDSAYDLKLPKGSAERAASAIAALPIYQAPKIEYVVHRVRSGETLSTIAERYRTSVTAIMRVNGIRSANRIWPGQRLRIPSRA